MIESRDFDSYYDANACLNKSVKRDDEKEGIFLEIPSRAKSCRGIITGWDLGATLDELLQAMVVTSNVLAIERER